MPGRCPNSLDEVRCQWPPTREIEDRMHHPERQPRLLEIGEAEVPGEILRVDHVSDSERQRLAPSHNLAAHKQRERTINALPVRVPDVVLVVVVRHVLHSAIRKTSIVNSRTTQSRSRVTASVLEAVSRLIHHPATDEKPVVAAEDVVDVQLEPVARG